MSVALVSPAVARLERTERLRRKRAAATALRVAFPTLRQLRLEFKFDSPTNTPAAQSHLLHPPSRAFFEFPCPFADCGGQFDLNSAVERALDDPAHHVEGVLECCGTRPQRHASQQSCRLRLTYTVTAIFPQNT